MPFHASTRQPSVHELSAILRAYLLDRAPLATAPLPFFLSRSCLKRFRGLSRTHPADTSVESVGNTKGARQVCREDCGENVFIQNRSVRPRPERLSRFLLENSQRSRLSPFPASKTCFECRGAARRTENHRFHVPLTIRDFRGNPPTRVDCSHELSLGVIKVDASVVDEDSAVLSG